MSARREKRLRRLEKRVTALEVQATKGNLSSEIDHYWAGTARQHKRDAEVKRAAWNDDLARATEIHKAASIGRPIMAPSFMDILRERWRLWKLRR